MTSNYKYFLGKEEEWMVSTMILLIKKGGLRESVHTLPGEGTQSQPRASPGRKTRTTVRTQGTWLLLSLFSLNFLEKKINIHILKKCLKGKELNKTIRDYVQLDNI